MHDYVLSQMICCLFRMDDVGSRVAFTFHLTYCVFVFCEWYHKHFHK